ncbi:transcriptional regulator, ArsR family [Schinkia azotoformans MEV2011]|uniref:Transcriptional regulator, ArsR family n=1 Tax=Schinkia azotoformans MEV2011 TaxID=1348973 RepID=A0A072NLB5_SCHAZ|nr:metalloregulator ArsR/SmtB family transcription factor [Schinkia azotoformans]KEF37698.1 transcriptional regulator, ArsR family [Schinkia azotoformans MEV2011]MEC1697918.1 metalloregulator ArsR/SmtB family transcription factor [Schinkia azotoformans]MEC1717147.1 metalloregulator ArsR/SmtB family transcription factor [Schinkia azotoformans]MEC1725146.1 metalloregulator ArsR/SmtB family transcription factor [Schinkia azotoformans]MEC1741961.1 metalloregulator ArsR/SmtB family transcription fa
MRDIIPLKNTSMEQVFSEYEGKFKALADQKRLHILNLLCQQDSICVCDLTALIDMPQSKLSYHLKILLDANFIIKETKGTWSYYKINSEEINQLLSPILCCLFRPSQC